MQPSFIDSIADLQRQRQVRASRQPDEVQFHDRSAFCTAALAAYLGTLSPARSPANWSASRRMRSIKSACSVQNLGVITPTEARRISFEEALRFERIHEDTYRNFGFEIVQVEPGSLSERVAAIKEAIEQSLL